MEKVNFQPEHMNTVSPYLMVESVQELIDFTKQVFNAQLRFKLDRPNGQIMHAELIIGDSIIMAGEPMKEFGVFPCSLFLYIDDCDSVYKNALAYGCTSVRGQRAMRHAGQKKGGVLR